MAAATSSASEFLEGATGSLVWLLVIVATWWFLFHAPRGRRIFRRQISICAPAERVWSALMLEPSPPGGWGGAAPVESQKFIDGPPIRHEAMVGVPGRPGVTRALLSRVLHIEPAQRLESECETLDGVAVKDATRASLRLVEENGLTRVEHEISREVRGLFGHWSLSRLYDHYWDHLRAHCEGSSTLPATASPIRRTTAWLVAAAVVVGAIAVSRAEDAELGWSLILTAALLQLAILVHELGHFCVMRAFRHVDAKIMFLPFFGVATPGARRMSSRYERAIIALGGPGVSALVALALAPFAHWGFAAMQIDCSTATADGGDYDIIANAEEFASTLLIFLVPLNLVQLAPIGSLDGAAVVGALVRGRGMRALLVAAVLAALGFAAASEGSASYVGGLATMLVALWAYALLARNTLDRRSEPMSRRQSAITLAALVVTIAVHVGVFRALLPDFVAATSQPCHVAPVESDDGSPFLYRASDDHTAAP